MTCNVGSTGEISLPDSVRVRYGMHPDTPVRLIETRAGVLIVPLTDEPMSDELAQELQEWQTLGASAWDTFAFEEPT